MLGLAGFVMRGAMQAALAAAASLVLALILPPFAWLSGAVIGLVTLRKGLAQGALVGALALAGAALLAALAAGRPGAALMLAALVWLPVLAAALVLRRTVRLEAAVLVAGACGFALVALTFVMLPDPTAAWYEVLNALLPAERVQAELVPGGAEFDSAAWSQLLHGMARLMTGSMGAAVLLNTVLSLLLARWWQASLYNPGGFGEEFHALRLGRPAAAFVLAAGVLALTVRTDLVVNLALVAVVLFLFQGLAVSHAAVRLRGMGRGWLVGLYLLMLFALPQVTLVLAVLGLIDSWVDIRGRLAARAT